MHIHIHLWQLKNQKIRIKLQIDDMHWLMYSMRIHNRGIYAYVRTHIIHVISTLRAPCNDLIDITNQLPSVQSWTNKGNLTFLHHMYVSRLHAVLNHDVWDFCLNEEPSAKVPNNWSRSHTCTHIKWRDDGMTRAEDVTLSNGTIGVP